MKRRVLMLGSSGVQVNEVLYSNASFFGQYDYIIRAEHMADNFRDQVNSRSLVSLDTSLPPGATLVHALLQWNWVHEAAFLDAEPALRINGTTVGDVSIAPTYAQVNRLVSGSTCWIRNFNSVLRYDVTSVITPGTPLTVEVDLAPPGTEFSHNGPTLVLIYEDLSLPSSYIQYFDGGITSQFYGADGFTTVLSTTSVADIDRCSIVVNDRQFQFSSSPYKLRANNSMGTFFEYVFPDPDPSPGMIQLSEVTAAPPTGTYEWQIIHPPLNNDDCLNLTLVVTRSSGLVNNTVDAILQNTITFA